MDRTIQYFQDRTEYGSYDPIFPGYEEVEKKPFSNISRIELSQKKSFSNISRILENVADFDLQYFQAGNN